jgi:hypothetical protein
MRGYSWENQVDEEGVPGIGTREVEMDQENVWEFIKYAFKTLRRVAFVGFMAFIPISLPFTLLVTAWYQSTMVGARFFACSFIGVAWLVLAETVERVL